MRAMQKLDEAREKLEETNKEFDSARRKAKQAKMAFERAKQERHDLFMKCFDHVSNIIDDIYKALCRNQAAQAFLGNDLFFSIIRNFCNIYQPNHTFKIG